MKPQRAQAQVMSFPRKRETAPQNNMPSPSSTEHNGNWDEQGACTVRPGGKQTDASCHYAPVQLPPQPSEVMTKLQQLPRMRIAGGWIGLYGSQAAISAGEHKLCTTKLQH